MAMSRMDPTVSGVAFARVRTGSGQVSRSWGGTTVVAQWVRNRSSGPGSRVVRDTVVAQVEIQAGPLAVAAARATSFSVEIPQTS